MKNLPNCPVCKYRLEEKNIICPQCGNEEIEDMSFMDLTDKNLYEKRLEEKRRVWYRIAKISQKLALEREKLKEELEKERAEIKEKEKRWEEKQRELMKQLEEEKKKTERQQNLLKQIEKSQKPSIHPEQTQEFEESSAFSSEERSIGNFMKTLTLRTFPSPYTSSTPSPAQDLVRGEKSNIAEKELTSAPAISFPSLRSFEFNIARVNITSTLVFGINKKVDILLSKGRAQSFIEDLGGGVGLEMVLIPGGTFLMGSPDTEAERYENEGPQHEVTIAPFYMGKFTITQAQWQAVAALPQINSLLDPEPSKFEGGNRPVECVSWYEAIEFCERLSNKTGRSYRLPSEAEWEYACRAGTDTPFHFGITITPDLVNYDGNYPYGFGPRGKNRGQTLSVGSFQVANAFGLYDMHGNVWEWCADLWHENYQGAPTNGEVWDTDGDVYRVLRGGAWLSHAWYCRSAFRAWDPPHSRNPDLGFRVVVSVK